MVRKLDKGKSFRGNVALTFDDGYSDNYEIATPSLIHRNTPATFFLISNRIGSTKSYWWDELTRILLRPVRLPDELVIELRGTEHRLPLGDAVNYSKNQQAADRYVRAWAARAGSRMGFYYRVWKLLRPLTDRERDLTLGFLAEWAGTTRSEEKCPVALSREQARELASGGLIEIGSHSESHPPFSDLDLEAQRQEAIASKVTLEKVIEGPVRSFAYPYGDHDADTPTALKEAGYNCACTAEPRRIRSRSDPYLLPRVAVSDWTGKEFENRLFKLFGF
jgi:peptidoglycan/xylan/chitin deacetylase (PgdA/CDA1 family)